MMTSPTHARSIIYLTLISTIFFVSLASEQKFKKIHINYGSKIVLGGLFPVHSKGHQDEDRCGSLHLEKGIQRLEAMLFALDQINNEGLYDLPFKLGAIILDTCASDSYALEQSLQFLQYSCGLGKNISRKVTAVVGASNSDVTSSVANIFRLFQIPQVSYASTSQELDDLHKYKYFFRVVPSDRFQVKVILDILLEFGWTFVSVIAAEGEYGESAVENLQDLLRNPAQEEICLATVEILGRNAEEEEYKDVLRRLQANEKAKVVVVFLNEDKIRHLLEVCEKMDLPKDRFLWLASDGWGSKERIVRDYEEWVENSITILPKRYTIQGFDEYFKSLKPESNTRNPWFIEFWESQFDCAYKTGLTRRRKGKICTGNEDLGEFYRQEGLVPMVMDSVHLLATAIETLCKKSPRYCNNPDIMEQKYRNSLVEIIQNTSMNSSQGHGMVISFDKTRSVPVNYTIFQFRKTSKSGEKEAYSYKPIGEWNPFERLKLRGYTIWNREEGHAKYRRPTSRCSNVCKAGEQRLPSREFKSRCCWTCRLCDDGYYLPEPHTTCIACPKGKMPSFDKTSCVDLQAEYFGQTLGDAWALMPFIFSVVGLICTFVVVAIFVIYRETPIIMASGRELCYVILVGIALCHSFTFVALLEPTEVSCGILRVGMGLGLSVCYSAIFTKTNRISRIFDVDLKLTKRPSFISPGSQIIICVCLVLIQITLTVLWLIVKPPSIAQRIVSKPPMWVVVCELDGMSIVLGLLYNIILLILCTIYAFKTRKIPENFNETKWISFTVYSCCIGWASFIPIYCSAMQDYQFQTSVLCMTVSGSGSVTLVCIFLPKIYIVLFHPERNVRHLQPSPVTSDSHCDGDQPVRYLRTNPEASPKRPHSPFLFVRKTELDYEQR